MKEAIKNNKKFIIIGLIIIVLLLIGLAFAYLRTTLQGDKDYAIRAGTLNLTLTEGNELTLEKLIPLEDSEGMNLNGFNFSLTNEGNIDTDYTIYLDDIELDTNETRMPDSSIRYSLTRNDEVGDAKDLTSMGSNPNRRVDYGTISPDETVNYTLRIWIDYDATTEEASGKTFKGKLRVEATQPVGDVASTVLLNNIPKENQYDDGVDTFITGEDPNNYIWYSGKLWRAVSINDEEKTVKLVTQWNISSINYSSGDSAFEGSYVEEWLNDTSVDGFLYNLRDYERFIKLDSKWNATMMSDTSKPPETTIVEDAVGLLNIYEYAMTCNNNSYVNSYLFTSLEWWTLTPYDASYVWYGDNIDKIDVWSAGGTVGIRPSINLRSDVKIVAGSGTEDDPYRLLGDNDEENSGILLNTRYSGEYITFGTGENNLYRIVSHENGVGTKITSAEPLKENDSFKTLAFGDSVYYSTTNTIGTFLNGEYLTNNVGNDYIDMIEDNTTWYLGAVGNGDNYKLAKYTDTTSNELILRTTQAKVGLLRLGELMSGKFKTGNIKNDSYWLLTPSNNIDSMRFSYFNGSSNFIVINDASAIKPALNLKSNVVITGGDGTKENPFTIELSN